jgi:hypothetical protein
MIYDIENIAGFLENKPMSNFQLLDWSLYGTVDTGKNWKQETSHEKN